MASRDLSMASGDLRHFIIPFYGKFVLIQMWLWAAVNLTNYMDYNRRANHDGTSSQKSFIEADSNF